MDIASKRALQREIVLAPDLTDPLTKVLETAGATKEAELGTAVERLPMIDPSLASLTTEEPLPCRVFGVQFHLHAMKGDALTERLRHTKMYERHLSSFLVANLKPGRVFFDVGANVGYHTVLAANLVGPQGKVVAFEPHPALRGVLARNVELNGLKNVEIDSRAVGLSRSTGRMDLSVADSGQTAVVLEPTSGELTNADVVVETLDQVCIERGFAPHIIKLDAEGMEADILLGGRRLFSEIRPVFTMEFCPINNTRARSRLATALTWLRDIGYHAHFFRGHDFAAFEPIPMDLLIQLGDYWVAEGHSGFVDLVFLGASLLKR